MPTLPTKHSHQAVQPYRLPFTCPTKTHNEQSEIPAEHPGDMTLPEVNEDDMSTDNSDAASSTSGDDCDTICGSPRLEDDALQDDGFGEMDWRRAGMTESRERNERYEGMSKDSLFGERYGGLPFRMGRAGGGAEDEEPERDDDTGGSGGSDGDEDPEWKSDNGGGDGSGGAGGDEKTDRSRHRIRHDFNGSMLLPANAAWDFIMRQELVKSERVDLVMVKDILSSQTHYDGMESAYSENAILQAIERSIGGGDGDLL